MTEQLEADAGYQGFISKNVLHKHWQVQEVNQHAWNLADFLEWIDLPKRLPKRAKTQGLGRNCTMFEQARWWAYSQVLSYRLAGDSGGFHDAVLRYCETINEGFPSPLNFSEVKATAKSIACWTLKYYKGSAMSDEAWAKHVADTHTPDKQRARQVKQVASRLEATKTAWEQAKAMRQGGSTIRVIATALSISVGTVSNWLKADWRNLQELPTSGSFFVSRVQFAYISYQPTKWGREPQPRATPLPCKGCEAPRKIIFNHLLTFIFIMLFVLHSNT